MSVLVAGESLVDVLVRPSGEVRRPGGSPMNVAVGLARLGVPTQLLTRVGRDADGRLVRDHLAASGVALAPGADADGPTSVATARLDADGHAAYEFELDRTLPPYELEDGVTLVHTGSLGAALEPGRSVVLNLVAAAAGRGLTVTFDPNARPALAPDADQAWSDVRQLAAYATVVKLSDEDLAFYRPAAPVESVARSLLSDRTRLVIVTRGGTGALGVTTDGQVEVAAPTSRVVDTVGAGDSFMSALVAQLFVSGAHDLSLDAVRRLVAAAHEAAAVCVAREGADPPRLDELPAGWPRV